MENIIFIKLCCCYIALLAINIHLFITGILVCVFSESQWCTASCAIRVGNCLFFLKMSGFCLGADHKNPCSDTLYLVMKLCPYIMFLANLQIRPVKINLKILYTDFLFPLFSSKKFTEWLFSLSSCVFYIFLSLCENSKKLL